MTVHTDSGAHPASYSMGSRISSGDKAAGLKIVHSHPSNADLKNEWSYTPTLPVRHHGVNTGKFASYVHII